MTTVRTRCRRIPGRQPITCPGSKGKHNMKFGADIIRRQVNFFRPLTGKGFFNLCGNGTSHRSVTGYEVTDLLIGFTCNYQVGPAAGRLGNPQLGNRILRPGRLARDPQVDLESGSALRPHHLAGGEVQSPGELQHLHRADPDRRPGWATRGASFPTAYNNFAPRIGFAYDLIGDGTTKISGGYGIFYFVDRGGISNQLAQNPPFSGQVNYSFANGYRITFTGRRRREPRCQRQLSDQLQSGRQPLCRCRPRARSRWI